MIPLEQKLKIGNSELETIEKMNCPKECCSRKAIRFSYPILLLFSSFTGEEHPYSLKDDLKIKTNAPVVDILTV